MAYCGTIYYINVSTGTLQAFFTNSNNFATERGTTPGMLASQAQSREGMQLQSGCKSGIGIGTRNDAATIYLFVPSASANGAQPTDPVSNISAESNQNQVGLLFC
jgi:hypothetical protein